MGPSKNSVGRRLRHLTCLIVFLGVAGILFGRPTAASEFEFHAGHWVGEPRRTPSGVFESCIVSEHNRADELLMLQLDTSMSLTIGIFEHEWKGKLFVDTKLLAVVDHKVIHWGAGMLQRQDVLAFRIKDADRALDAISKGQKLLVSFGDQSVQFDLDQGDAAMGYLVKCVNDEAGKSSET